MNDWQTYRLGDFIPFTPEIYFRLIERINEAAWPLHILVAVLGLVIALLALRGKRRPALALLAPAWLASAAGFHFSYYAELNWTATWFGWSFIAQAGLLLAALAPRNRCQETHSAERIRIAIGAAIAVFGVAAYPLIAPLAGNGWPQAEIFALHADPTAIASLGITLIVARGSGTWLLTPIPMLWCLITTLTLIPLEAPWALLPLAAAVVTLLTLAGGLLVKPAPTEVHPSGE